jgi:hypothetical protein
MIKELLIEAEKSIIILTNKTEMADFLALHESEPSYNQYSQYSQTTRISLILSNIHLFINEVIHSNSV